MLLAFVFVSCNKNKFNYAPTPYVLEIPSHFPDMPIPLDNPMTVEGVELGRFLFYDKKLSVDGTVSCASCHRQSSSFSDPNQFSSGVNGALGNRNSMSLVNMGWNTSFFWDGRSKTLEDQILEPIVNPVEMNNNWDNVVNYLNADPLYQSKFREAFNVAVIDSIHVSMAIAQFVRTMISGNSKFDVIYKVENNLTLTASEQLLYNQVTQEELAGYDLFKSLNGADCFHCHKGPLMQVDKFSNNGLDATFSDLGRGGVTNNSNDNGKFKVPTLRNIEFSAPYMHDGRFATIDEVIDHYSHGVEMSSTIDPLMEFGFQGGVQLDNDEKQLLKAFLFTLTDHEFVNNPAFKKP